MAGLIENYRQLKSDVASVKRTLRLAAALPRFFRERLSVQVAEKEVRSLLDSRVERFLEMVRTQIYERPENPYNLLLKHAGCEFSDLETQVHHHGLEETLAKLAGEGVYLTSDEFKGKIEVARGGTAFRVSPRDFERRDLTAGVANHSSGTRNTPLHTFSPLEARTLIDMEKAILYAAHDLFSCAHAVYEPIIAGRVVFVLTNAKLGIPTDRWFALELGPTAR